MCVFVLWTSCLRAKILCYYMWPLAKKFYHGWTSTMTSSNEISWKWSHPEMKSCWRPCPEQKTFTIYYALFPLHNKQLRLWEFWSLDDPWSFAASHSFMHFINRCAWKSSQYYIVISMMTSFMRVSQKLVFHQSKCICAIKRILSTTAMHVSSSSFMYLRIPCYCDACLNSSALRVGVKTLHNTILYLLCTVVVVVVFAFAMLKCIHALWYCLRFNKSLGRLD